MYCGAQVREMGQVPVVLSLMMVTDSMLQLLDVR